jgi:hypothetical protein
VRFISPGGLVVERLDGGRLAKVMASKTGPANAASMITQATSRGSLNTLAYSSMVVALDVIRVLGSVAKSARSMPPNAEASHAGRMVTD